MVVANIETNRDETETQMGEREKIACEVQTQMQATLGST